VTVTPIKNQNFHHVPGEIFITPVVQKLWFLLAIKCVHKVWDGSLDILGQDIP
jgi:hypothetical protein